VTFRLVGALVACLILVGYGLLEFDRGDEMTRASLALGIGFLTLTIAALIRTGWWGSADGWFLAAIGAAIWAWAIYEGMRRGGCGIDDAGTPVPCFPDVGPLAGVVLGGAAGLVILGLAWWRLPRVRPPGT
jgi:multisubunit Na+/H+ antiporter MnhB subunit